MKLATRTFERDDWYITSPYGERINPVTKKKQFHSGCDYGTNKQNWKQYALEDGVVTRVGYNAKGYGHYMDIQYPRIKKQLFYAHLKTIYVKKGDKVTHDTCIGLTGATGQVTGIHLHLGLKPIGGSYEDPEKYDYQPIEKTKPVERDETRDQLQVIKNKLRIRTEPNLKGAILGFAELGYYNDLEKFDADGYTWHKVADNNWIANVDGYVKLLPSLKVGDKVTLKEPLDYYIIEFIDGDKANITMTTDINNLIKYEEK